MESDNTIPYLNYRFDSSNLVLPDLNPFFSNHKLKTSFSGDPCSDNDTVTASISNDAKVIQKNNIHLISNLVGYLTEDLMNEQIYQCKGSVSYKTFGQGNDDMMYCNIIQFYCRDIIKSFNPSNN